MLKLEIPRELGTNPIFNVEDLTPYRSPVNCCYSPPIIIDFRRSAAFSSASTPPPPLRRHHIEEIEDILENEIVLTANGENQRYLVH